MAAPTSVCQRDVALVASLSYLMLDMLLTWESFSKCPKPIHVWMFGSYGMVIASRLVVLFPAAVVLGGTESAASRPLFMRWREKGPSSRVLSALFWCSVAPLFSAWSVLGAVWSWQVMTQAPEFMPSSMHIAFLVLWLGMSMLWVLQIVGTAVWTVLLECRMRQAGRDLREIEDEDVRERWGEVGRLDDYTALPTAMAGGGLTPKEIKALAGVGCYSEADAEAEEDCPICLNSYKAGDPIRRLGTCGHTFHRSCVDLWLLRSADCPLCKQTVRAAL